MISPHTPPGTEVVALVDKVTTPPCLSVFRGRIYTVAMIVEMDPVSGEKFGVVMQEHGEVEAPGIPGAFVCCRLSWFRPLDLGGLDAFLDGRRKIPTGAPA